MEQAKFEARDITVWTDQLPTGVFANPDSSITYVTEEMVFCFSSREGSGTSEWSHHPCPIDSSNIRFLDQFQE
jgi:hypothetical protein